MFMFMWNKVVSRYVLVCREMEEISSFIKGAICDPQCLGRCLYIHGVPGTGKVKSITSA